MTEKKPMSDSPHPAAERGHPLPRCRAGEGPAEPPSASRPGATREPGRESARWEKEGRILLVEDEADQRRLVASILRGAGHLVAEGSALKIIANKATGK